MLKIERIEKSTKINHSQGSVNIPNPSFPDLKPETIVIHQVVARLHLVQLFIVL
jgi:hypothetical protein